MTNKAIKWLENEYPNGVELIYIDYRDSFDENPSQLEKILKQKDEDDEIIDWGEWESENYIINEYKEKENINELDEETEEEMREWLREHDTSNPTKDLLKNTRNKLFFIETNQSSISYEYSNEKEWKEFIKSTIKKFSKNKQEEKEIRYVLGEQFYEAPISFYFYAEPLELYKALWEEKGKYITIDGAYFSTIERGCGSNWLGNQGIFKIQIEKEAFIENFGVDDNKENGYGWGSIAGQCGYDKASIFSHRRNTNYQLIKTTVSEKMIREKKLQKQWDKTHKCNIGDFDMNWNRHSGEKTYSNDYPCGNKCSECGTFWID